ncbi:MAG TPA: recombinase RecA [bacterium]|nr:recombinase RecA [bacterium]HNS48770.1 recombinase RecA [bacterium]
MEAKNKSGLNEAIKEIQKEFGKGSIMRLGERVAERIACIPTGALSLDVALGIGGIPRGRVTEIFGPESSGKTTLALHIIAEAQKSGGQAAFVDAEHALDPEYAKKLGVDINNLLLSQPDSGEQALEIVDRLIKSNALDVVVVDSVAALVPRAELEGAMGDSVMGLQARLMSQALRKLTSVINRTNTAALFLNQIREKIGVFFGNPETTPGGRALKFYTSIRLDVRRIGSIESEKNIVGNHVRVKIVKNKVAPPFKEALFDIYFNQGISQEGCLLDLGLEQKLLEKKGNSIYYQEQALGAGREQARLFLKENRPLREKLETELRGRLLTA